MTEFELRVIFYFLHNEFNKNNLFYFKLLDMNNIGAYFKDTNKLFATFYVKRLWKHIGNIEKDSLAKEIKIEPVKKEVIK